MNVQCQLFSIFLLFSFSSAACMQAFYLQGAQLKLRDAEKAFNTNSETDLGDLNGIDSLKETVLGRALRDDYSLEFISFLLQRGANPFLKVGADQVAIITACALRGNLKQLYFFYDKRVRYPADDQSLHILINHVTWAYKTYGPFKNHKTTEELYIPALKLLIKMGCPLEILNTRGETPLSHAVRLGYHLLTRKLLKHGADPFAEIDPFWPIKPEPCTMRDECLKLLRAAKKKTFCALNRNPELYFSILPIDVMKEASNYVQ